LEIHHYPLIPKKPTQKAVLRRMGYHKDTVVSEKEMTNIVAMMTRAADICRPKAQTCLMRIADLDAQSLTLENGLKLCSINLARMMTGSSHALLMGSTLDKRVVEIITRETKEGDAVFAVVLDAYASECVDDALDFIMQANGLSDFRLGKQMTKHRFSAGYGDLDLSYQKDLFDLLKMGDMGVTINENYLMTPEKSVIAICGVKRI